MKNIKLVEVKDEKGELLYWESSEEDSKSSQKLETSQKSNQDQAENTETYIAERGISQSSSIDTQTLRKRINKITSIFEPDQEVLNKKISEIKVECGIKISTKGNIILASGAAEGSIKLTIVFK